MLKMNPALSINILEYLCYLLYYTLIKCNEMIIHVNWRRIRDDNHSCEVVVWSYLLQTSGPEWLFFQMFNLLLLISKFWPQDWKAITYMMMRDSEHFIHKKLPIEILLNISQSNFYLRVTFPLKVIYIITDPLCFHAYAQQESQFRHQKKWNENENMCFGTVTWMSRHTLLFFNNAMGLLTQCKWRHSEQKSQIKTI